MYLGQFKNNKMEGEGTFKFPDGGCYKGNFENNEQNGFGEFTWTNGKIYRGLWKNGKRNGPGEVYCALLKEWKKGLWNKGKLMKRKNKTNFFNKSII